MNDVYLLLGSNQGQPAENLISALHSLEQQCGTIIERSSIYETEAWGIKDQPAFLNQAVLLRTTHTPEDVLRILKQIEAGAGRLPTTRWGPRVIDIDILFYADQVIDLPNLKIPHPFIQDRRFTLVPLAEIAPDLMHPIYDKTISVLLQSCRDTCEVKLKNSTIF